MKEGGRLTQPVSVIWTDDENVRSGLPQQRSRVRLEAPFPARSATACTPKGSSVNAKKGRHHSPRRLLGRSHGAEPCRQPVDLFRHGRNPQAAHEPEQQIGRGRFPQTQDWAEQDFPRYRNIRSIIRSRTSSITCKRKRPRTTSGIRSRRCSVSSSVVRTQEIAMATSPGGSERPKIRGAWAQPRPTKGILVAMTVRKRTFASSGRLAMYSTARATCATSIVGSAAVSPLA